MPTQSESSLLLIIIGIAAAIILSVVCVVYCVIRLCLYRSAGEARRREQRATSAIIMGDSPCAFSDTIFGLDNLNALDKIEEESDGVEKSPEPEKFKFATEFNEVKTRK